METKLQFFGEIIMCAGMVATNTYIIIAGLLLLIVGMGIELYFMEKQK